MQLWSYLQIDLHWLSLSAFSGAAVPRTSDEMWSLTQRYMGSFLTDKILFCFVCFWQVFGFLTRSEQTVKKSKIVWCVIPWSEAKHSGAFPIIKLPQSKNNKQMRFDMRRNSRASVRACMTMDIMRKNNLQRTLSRALIWAHLIASPVIKKCFSPDRVIYSQMAG